MTTAVLGFRVTKIIRTSFGESNIISDLSRGVVEARGMRDSTDINAERSERY